MVELWHNLWFIFEFLRSLSSMKLSVKLCCPSPKSTELFSTSRACFWTKEPATLKHCPPKYSQDCRSQCRIGKDIVWNFCPLYLSSLSGRKYKIHLLFFRVCRPPSCILEQCHSRWCWGPEYCSKYMKFCHLKVWNKINLQSSLFLCF